MPKLDKVLTAPPVAHAKRGAQPEGLAENGKLTRAKVKTSIAVHSFPGQRNHRRTAHHDQRRSDCCKADDH